MGLETQMRLKPPSVHSVQSLVRRPSVVFVGDDHGGRLCCCCCRIVAEVVVVVCGSCVLWLW